MNDKPNSNQRLIPVTKWNDFHTWPPIGGLRHLIFYENTNGFNHCIVRIGRRVLINEESFLSGRTKTSQQLDLNGKFLDFFTEVVKW